MSEPNVAVGPGDGHGFDIHPGPLDMLAGFLDRAISAFGRVPDRATRVVDCPFVAS